MLPWTQARESSQSSAHTRSFVRGLAVRGRPCVAPRAAVRAPGGAWPRRAFARPRARPCVACRVRQSPWHGRAPPPARVRARNGARRSRAQRRCILARGACLLEGAWRWSPPRRGRRPTSARSATSTWPGRRARRASRRESRSCPRIAARGSRARAHREVQSGRGPGLHHPRGGRRPMPSCARASRACESRGAAQAPRMSPHAPRGSRCRVPASAQGGHGLREG